MIIYIDDDPRNRASIEKLSDKYPTAEIMIVEYQEDAFRMLDEFSEKEIIIITDWNLYPRDTTEAQPINPIDILKEATRRGIQSYIVTDGHTDYIPRLLEINSINAEIVDGNRFNFLEGKLKEHSSRIEAE